jgi:hypothetical protein
VSTRQLVLVILVLTVACCAVMWSLEDFRQRKLISDFRAELANLPTYLKGAPDA